MLIVVNFLVGSYLITAFFISLSLMLLNYPRLRKMNRLKLAILFLSSPILVVKNIIKEREDEKV